MNKILEESIKNSSLVQAAVTEAVHRYYYDRVLVSEKEKNRWTPEEKEAFKESEMLISNLWNLNPGWRYTLLNASKRYQADVDTKAVSIYGKPKEIREIELNIKIKK